MSKPDQNGINNMMGMTQGQFENWVDAGEYSDQDVIDLRNEALRLRKQLDGTADVIKVKENALTQLKDANDELSDLITQQAKELEEARKIEFPRQMEGRGGWKIDYNFIEQIQQEVEHAFAHDVSSFEQIEAVLLAIENLALGQEGEANQ